MRVAYADPPYLGCGRLYRKHHPNALQWDDLDRHRVLIEMLSNDFPDGWAMSASSVSLQKLLPLCPSDVRVAAWVKPFAVFKPNVGVAYAWEPVIWRGGRLRTRQQATVRDWISSSITLERGLVGAKPDTFSFWLFELLNLEPTDEFVDLFPGSGAVAAAWETWKRDQVASEQFELTYG